MARCAWSASFGRGDNVCDATRPLVDYGNKEELFICLRIYLKLYLLLFPTCPFHVVYDAHVGDAYKMLMAQFQDVLKGFQLCHLMFSI